MTRRPAPLPPVALVDRWDGFCLPCGDDARPLALTWTGRRGLRAWLGGGGWADGELRLTCACCGGVDVVGWEDEPEPVVAEVPEVPEQPEAAPGTVALPAQRTPVVRLVPVLDLDTPAAPHGVVPAGSADADALDLLRLVG